MTDWRETNRALWDERVPIHVARPPDPDRWARTMVALLAPGGRFYLAELQPISDVFPDDDLTVVRSYFNDEPLTWEEPGPYADLDAPTEHKRSVEWQHGLGDVVSALIAAGLRIELLREHDHALFPRWPLLVRDGAIWRLPEGAPSLPFMYSVRATLDG